MASEHLEFGIERGLEEKALSGKYNSLKVLFRIVGTPNHLHVSGCVGITVKYSLGGGGVFGSGGNR
jgi:hypothetical protein